MKLTQIGERDFTVADQALFGAASGDINPLHMDADAARRTMAGYPVVHGMHLSLWSLDRLYKSLPQLPALHRMSVRFKKIVHVGEHVRLHAAIGPHVELKLTTGDVEVMSVSLSFDETDPTNDAQLDGPLLTPQSPRILTFEQAAADQGCVAIRDGNVPVADMFPNVAAKLGPLRVICLARTSFLVGMVCPGLNSVFSRLDIAARPGEMAYEEMLQFKVTNAHRRFQLLEIAISGGGWFGSMEAFVRAAPTIQASFAEIRQRVQPAEFAGSHALVVGGSRGLGEVAAKILASGGANVSITYNRGEAEAINIRKEIVESGGACDLFRYDVLSDAVAQLGALNKNPDQLYYFATPHIFRRKTSGFETERFKDFLKFYVDGFHNICAALRARGASRVVAFYPSSISVETRPANMTEYTMAKAAGEILCRDMQQFDNFGPIIISRLPRLQTDQSATLSMARAADPFDALLPVVRQVHAEWSGPASAASA